MGPRSIKVRFKINTGSQVNVLPSSVYHSLGINGPLMQTQSQLSAYSGDRLKVVGTVLLDCVHKDSNLKPLFYIVDTDNPPLLGLRSSIDLNAIKLVYNVQT